MTLTARERVLNHLDAARIHLDDAIAALEDAARTSRDTDGPHWLHGQIDAYTIATLRTFATDENRYQPGTIGGLIRALDDPDDTDYPGDWDDEEGSR